jgi:TRAP-type C4-dicarboxylate transport system permease small subunit
VIAMQIAENIETGATSANANAAGSLRKIERFLASLVGLLAAALVVAEIVVLFAGVSSRYLLHKPLIWTDELAGILFLWLAMLGAVLAF